MQRNALYLTKLQWGEFYPDIYLWNLQHLQESFTLFLYGVQVKCTGVRKMSSVAVGNYAKWTDTSTELPQINIKTHERIPGIT